MRYYLSFLLVFIAITCGAQSAASDALFGKGIDSFKRGKYADAIKAFKECQTLDEIELDSLDFRKEYTKAWIAHCYYKLNKIDEAEAVDYSDYIWEPVDRRLTVKSDSISKIAFSYSQSGSFGLAVYKMEETLKEEQKVLGANHYYTASTENNIATCYAYDGNTDDAQTHLDKAKAIYKAAGMLQSCGYAKSLLTQARIDITNGKFDAIQQIVDEVVAISNKWKSEQKRMLVSAYGYMVYVLGQPSPHGEYKKYTDLLYDALMTLDDADFEMYSEEVLWCAYAKMDYQEYGDGLKLTSRTLRCIEKYPDAITGDNPYYIQLLSYHAQMLSGLTRDIEAIEVVKRAINLSENSSTTDKNELDELYEMLSSSYNEMGEAELALSAAQEAYKRASRRKDDHRLTMARAKQDMSSSYSQLGKTKEAVKALEEAMQLMAESVGKDNAEYSVLLFKLAEIEVLENPEKAIADYRACIDVNKALEIPSYSQLTGCYRRLHDLYFNEEKADECKVYANELKQISENKKLDDGARDCALCNYYLIQTAEAGMTPKSKIEIYEKVISIFEKYPGWNVFPIKSSLANAYAENKEYDKALAIITAIVEGTRNNPVLSDAHIEYCIDLAFVQSLLGRVDEAKASLAEAMQLANRAFGKNSIGYVCSVISSAYRFACMELSNEALTLCKSIYKKVAQISDPTSFDIGLYYLALSKSENQLGHSIDCVEHGEIALDIFRKINRSDKIIETLINLGQAYHVMGDYPKALAYLKEALAISDKQTDYNRFNQTTINIFSALSDVCNTMGNYSDAGVYADCSVQIAEKIGGERNFTLLNAMTNQAGLYSQFGKYQEADKLADEIISKSTAMLGEDNSYINDCLALKASINSQLGNNDEAIAALEQLIKKDRKINTLIALYSAYTRGGQHEKALPLADEIYDFMNTHDAANSIVGAYWLMLFAVNYYQLGDSKKTEEYLSKAIDIHSSKVLDNFLLMTKEERVDLWNSASKLYQTYLPNICYSDENHDRYAGLLYDATLFSKGLMLQTDNSITDVIKSSGNEKLSDDYAELLAVTQEQKRISALYNDTSLDVAHRLRLSAIADSLYKDIDKRERALMSALSEVAGNYTSKLATKWTDVRKSLRKGQIAVEFEVANPQDDELQYFALVLTPNSKSPKYIKLVSQDELFKYLPFQTATEKDLHELSRAIWSPILSEFDNVNEIFFSPVGELYNIPIESLPMPYIDSIQLSQVYNVYRLSSTREVAASHKGNVESQMAIYGGLKYNSSADELTQDALKYDPNLNRDASFVAFIDNEDERGQKKKLDPLPGTEDEAKSIISLVDKQFNDRLSLTPYLGAAGTEASFKALSGKNVNIIHVGTHGFYFPQQTIAESSRLKEIFNLFNNVNIKTAETDEDIALSRCGLYMTGAQNRLNGEKIAGVDDGILTAKEISVLNLENVDLAVLSACSTGTGDITGDGVFGLQRGFKKAGTKAILMSLWSVNDASTSLLMTEFYRRWLSTGDMHEALESAKAAVRAKEQWKSPYYWAPFVLLDAVN